MEFYTYQYFVNQSQQTHFFKYFILITLLFLLFWITLKTFRSQNKMKYRDLIILISLTIAFITGIQINQYEIGKNNKNNSSQMVNFLDNIGNSNNISPENLSANSKYLKDEIIIKIGTDYYQVDMNSDLSSFKLEETNLMNSDDVKMVKE